jgi:hypothetical protein
MGGGLSKKDEERRKQAMRDNIHRRIAGLCLILVAVLVACVSRPDFYFFLLSRFLSIALVILTLASFASGIYFLLGGK